MNYKFDNGILKIELPERIDANNANAVEKELFEVPFSKTTKEILLDAENLNYISSLGLRIILKFKKSFKNTPLSIINASDTVYNVFDDTGFSSFITVRKKIRFIDINSLKLIGAGMYGAVYRINEEQILKVFYGINSENDIQPIIKTIRSAFVHDIPTIIPFEIVNTEKGIGMILELLNSEMMSTLMENNPEKLDKYVSEMVKLSKSLANTPFEEGTLRSRNEMLISKLDNADKFLLPEEITTIKKYIDAVPQRNTAVHGDFHAKNIMVMDEKLILIDMDEFSLGHPLWDIANLYCIYQAMAHIDTKIADDMFSLGGKIPYENFYFKIVGCTLAQAEIIWDKFFNGYFSDTSEEDKAQILKLVEFYATFKFVTFLVDICKAVKDNPNELAGKVRNIRYFLAELDKKDHAVLIKGLDLWK